LQFEIIIGQFVDFAKNEFYFWEDKAGYSILYFGLLNKWQFESFLISCSISIW